MKACFFCGGALESCFTGKTTCTNRDRALTRIQETPALSDIYGILSSPRQEALTSALASVLREASESSERATDNGRFIAECSVFQFGPFVVQYVGDDNGMCRLASSDSALPVEMKGDKRALLEIARRLHQAQSKARTVAAGEANALAVKLGVDGKAWTR